MTPEDADAGKLLTDLAVSSASCCWTPGGPAFWLFLGVEIPLAILMRGSCSRQRIHAIWIACVASSAGLGLKGSSHQYQLGSAVLQTAISE